MGQGNRKDIRNAVEAAHAASAWATTTGHNKGQILYYVAENLSVRVEEFAQQIRRMTGCNQKEASREVEASIERLFTYAAWADKYDGMVHRVPFRLVSIAMPEPIGVMGIISPEEHPASASCRWSRCDSNGQHRVVVHSSATPQRHRLYQVGRRRFPAVWSIAY